MLENLLLIAFQQTSDSSSCHFRRCLFFYPQKGKRFFRLFKMRDKAAAAAARVLFCRQYDHLFVISSAVATSLKIDSFLSAC